MKVCRTSRCFQIQSLVGTFLVVFEPEAIEPTLLGTPISSRRFAVPALSVLWNRS